MEEEWEPAVGLRVRPEVSIAREKRVGVSLRVRTMLNDVSKTDRRYGPCSWHLSFLRSGGREMKRGFLPGLLTRGVGSQPGEVGLVSRPLTILPTDLSSNENNAVMTASHNRWEEWFGVESREAFACRGARARVSDVKPVLDRRGPGHLAPAAQAFRSVPRVRRAERAPSAHRFAGSEAHWHEGERSFLWAPTRPVGRKMQSGIAPSMARPARHSGIRRFPVGWRPARVSVVAAC
jgi:hypothetical protein